MTALGDKRLDLDGYELEVEDQFAGAELDARLWIPHYLPHWSSRETAAARFSVADGALRLRIDADQQPWAPEWDGPLRVSSLQTGEHAGPLGSGEGQLHFREGLVVREEQESRALYAPQYGVFAVRARALADPHSMVAFWMIGFEDEPARSGEICIAEIFGRDVTADRAVVGMGLHPFGDPGIVDDFTRESLAIDAREPHEYAGEWTPEHVAFYVDRQLVRVVNQSPDYPMQFMLGIYEFASGPEPPSPLDRYPKEFVVESFRAYRRRRRDPETPPMANRPS